MTSPLRIVLVAPPVDFMANLYGFRSRRSKRPYRNQMPLGIGYIASILTADGFDVSLVDASALQWDTERTAREIASQKPDVVGVTAITFEAPAAYDLIRALKQRTDALMVLGGAHANSFYPHIPAECPEVDAIVAGDGEYTMREICRRLRDDGSLEEIVGTIVRRTDGTYTTFRERDPEPDLDRLPPPAYHLYPHHLYRPLAHRAKRLPSTSMITSRGCSYARCTYCELSGLIRKSYRRHSPERVVQDIETVIRVSGAREIYFQDDIFIAEPEWVEEFCDRLLTGNGIEVLWSCESRFQGVSRDLLVKMRQAGCWRIYYGFESGSQLLLDKIRKGFSVQEARDAAKIANEAGLDVVGFFMLGLPGETPADAEGTIRFACELGLDHAVFSLTVPHPNTELYGICEQEGTLHPGNDYFYKKASYVPHAYQSAAQLETLRNLAFRRFYFRLGYLARCLGRIRSWEDLRYYARGAVALAGYLD